MSPARKRLARAAAILAVLTAAIWFGRPRDVTEISIPQGQLIDKYLAAADHSDAYKAPLRPDYFRTVDEISQFASFRGKSVAANSNEVVFRSSFLGLDFYRSYILRRSTSNSPTVAVVSSIHSTGLLGTISFVVVKPLHRLATPWIIRRMVARATAAA